ncbi:MAG: helix-turn-helix transcriptional regulator [Lachnospiraceae bacterium]|nr:helix-turn-helix transcriptional regulator [Lachnospiraceae bacterium]
MPKAKNLKYYRLKSNLTQKEFAEAFGISRKTVINWEKAKTSIPASATARLAEFFGVPEMEFRNADQEMLQQLTDEDAIPLTDREKQSIFLFRQLPENMKELIRQAIVIMHENNQGDDH